MKFEIPKNFRLFIDAWRACAYVVQDADMDDYNYDDETIKTMYLCAEQMEGTADEIESEQKMLLEQVQKRFDERTSDNS